MTTVNTEPVKKNKREPLATVCGLTIAPARVGTILGSNGLNVSIQRTLDSVMDKKEALKKLGAPSVPSMPPKGEPKLTDEERESRKEAQKHYKEYKSEKYIAAYTKYTEWKKLKKSKSEIEKELKKAEKLAVDDVEKMAELEKQKKDIGDIQTKMDNILSDKDVELFVNRDVISKSRIRINREAFVAVASVLQEIIEQSALCTMDQANSEDKKIIIPLHALSKDHDKIPLFPLMSNLKSYKLLCEYQQAILDWEVRCKKFDAQVKNEAKKRNIKIKDHKAHKKNLRPQKPNPEEYHPANSNGTNFRFYVGRIFEQLRDIDSERFADLRISKDIKEFYSNLALDFCNRLVPWIIEIIEIKNIKTVGHDVVMRAVNLMLKDGGSGHYVEDLSITVKDRLDKLRTYNDKKKSNGEDVDDIDDIDDIDDEDEHEDDETDVLPRRRRRIV